MADQAPSNRLKQVRTLLWVLVALALIGAAALVLMPRDGPDRPMQQTTLQANLGGPFTLVGGDGKPFASDRLAGKPYAIFFGFTRCGDVCPTTLGRLAKLRREAGEDEDMSIVFVTIDPANDGPKEVGQYATLFNAPIVGLTGSQAQIDAVKKQYGIHAEPNHSGHGDPINHTATVLLYDREGKFAGTISPGEPDTAALDKLKQLIA